MLLVALYVLINCLILFLKGPTPKGYKECLSDRIPKTVYSRNEIRNWEFWTDNKSLLTQKITINFNFTDIYAMNNEISAAALSVYYGGWFVPFRLFVMARRYNEGATRKRRKDESEKTK